MNPQEATSVGTSAILYVLGIGFGALVAKGVMTQDQANALAPEIASVLVTAAGVGIIWWKKRQHSPEAVAAAIATTPAVTSAAVGAVNSNAVVGVKVVSNLSPSPQVMMDTKGNVRPDPASKS